MFGAGGVLWFRSLGGRRDLVTLTNCTPLTPKGSLVLIPTSTTESEKNRIGQMWLFFLFFIICLYILKGLFFRGFGLFADGYVKCILRIYLNNPFSLSGTSSSQSVISCCRTRFTDSIHKWLRAVTSKEGLSLSDTRLYRCETWFVVVVVLFLFPSLFKLAPRRFGLCVWWNELNLNSDYQLGQLIRPN